MTTATKLSPAEIGGRLQEVLDAAVDYAAAERRLVTLMADLMEHEDDFVGQLDRHESAVHAAITTALRPLDEDDRPGTTSATRSWTRSTSSRSRWSGTMPAEARGHVRKLPSGKWQLRYYDSKGGRHSGGAFSTKTEAWNHYRDVVEPELNGRPVARRDLTYSGLVEVFLERHAIVAKPRTITELRWRLKQSEEKFGTIPLAELEGMADEIAGYAVTLPERLRYPLMAAFRQALEAGIRYGYMTREPGEARRAEPDARPAGDPRLHARRAPGDRATSSARSRRLR